MSSSANPQPPILPPAPQGGHQPAPHPGYAPAPQYASAPVPTGRKSWALGFLAYVPVPMVGLVIAAIVMISVYPGTKRKGVPMATENARYAANWGFTVLAAFAIFAVYFVTLMVAFPESKTAGFFPIGAVIIGYFLLAIVHAIVVISGTVVSGTRVFRNRLSIPFIRSSTS